MSLKRQLLMAISIFALYKTAAAADILPQGYGTEPREYNLVNAEKWRRLKCAPDLVLVGSSKTRMLQTKYFKMNTANLGISASGCVTGLEILSRSKLVPKFVVVELGFASLFGDLDKNTVAAAVDAPAGRSIFSSDYAYKPLLMLTASLVPDPPDVCASPQLLARVRASNETIALTDSQKVSFERHVCKMRQYCEALRSRGSNVYFVELPMGETSNQSNRENWARGIIRNELQSSHFSSITISHKNYQTTDLIHLTQSSARMVASEIENFLSNDGHVAARSTAS